MADVPRSRDNLLFTPGPLTTSANVKQAMLRDVGSRDHEFIKIVRDVRARLAALGGGGDLECVLMQGSGTFGVEATIGSSVPRDGKLLAVVNGAYGTRLVNICKAVGI